MKALAFTLNASFHIGCFYETELSISFMFNVASDNWNTHSYVYSMYE